jgi:hypothetical protein
VPALCGQLHRQPPDVELHAVQVCLQELLALPVHRLQDPGDVLRVPQIPEFRLTRQQRDEKV